MNNGIFELYGPKENPFTEPRHVVSVCYRLMWNLKNSENIIDFTKVKKIDFSNKDGFFALVTTDKDKFVFDLSKVYDPIPDDLKDRKIDVTPGDHNVEVTINEIDITDYITGKGGGSVEIKPKKDEPKEEDNTEEDNPTEVLDDLVEDNADTDDEEQEEKKQEVVEDVEEKILKELEKRGSFKKDDE